MFVSVILDPGGIDSARALVNVLINNGFKKIQRACWESMSVSETGIAALKKEIDRVTDYYDTVRIYQFPVNNMFIITELKQKKWKRCIIKNSELTAPKLPGNVRSAGRVSSARTVSRSSTGVSRTSISPAYAGRPVARNSVRPGTRNTAVRTRPVRKH